MDCHRSRAAGHRPGANKRRVTPSQSKAEDMSDLILAHRYRLSLRTAPAQSGFRVVALVFFEVEGDGVDEDESEEPIAPHSPTGPLQQARIPPRTFGWDEGPPSISPSGKLNSGLSVTDNMSMSSSISPTIGQLRKIPPKGRPDQPKALGDKKKGTKRSRRRRYVVGTNDEPCHVSGSICAERAALVQLRFVPALQCVSKVVIVTDSADAVTPGMLCREFMASHRHIHPDTPIVLGGAVCSGCGFDVTPRVCEEEGGTVAACLEIDGICCGASLCPPPELDGYDYEHPLLAAEALSKTRMSAFRPMARTYHDFLLKITSLRILYPDPSSYIRLTAPEAVRMGERYALSHAMRLISRKKPVDGLDLSAADAVTIMEAYAGFKVRKLTKALRMHRKKSGYNGAKEEKEEVTHKDQKAGSRSFSKNGRVKAVQQATMEMGLPEQRMPLGQKSASTSQIEEILKELEEDAEIDDGEGRSRFGMLKQETWRRCSEPVLRLSKQYDNGSGVCMEMGETNPKLADLRKETDTQVRPLHSSLILGPKTMILGPDEVLFRYGSSGVCPITKKKAALHLLHLALVACAGDNRDDLHPIRYGAAVLFSNGSYVSAAQKKSLEYGCSYEAVGQLIPAIEKRCKEQEKVLKQTSNGESNEKDDVGNRESSAVYPVLLVQCDRYGLPHAPFAPARAYLAEYGHGDCEVVVLGELVFF